MPIPNFSRNEVRDIWATLQNNQIPEDVIIPEFILESWKRSRRYGVEAFKRKNYHIIEEKELEKRIKANQGLLDIASQSMNVLHAITKDTNFCITIADNEGYILKRIGNETDMDFTQYGNFVEGSNWSEEIMGTNAVGLVLVHDKPIQVYSYEHYCKCAYCSTCSAAPIHDEKGNIIGVLDLTGDYQNANAHTLGMVVASAKSVERAIKLRKIFCEATISNLHKEAIMHSIIEGIVAINKDGFISLINDQACKMLNTDSQNCLFKKLEEVLPADNKHFWRLINSGRHIFGETVQINTNSAKKKFIVNFSPLKSNDDENNDNGCVISMHELHTVINKIIGGKSTITFDSLIGESSNLKLAIEQAIMAAQTDSNVLLLGESGVGKDLFAQAIHNASDRKKEVFFALNCAAIPRELISSELFGYDEGAFTGARKGGNAGKFELADQGTIFLDEIGEMPLDLQATLLRVLEERAILRVGGKEFIPINVRLISATHKNLQELIKNGDFRHDLFYRLCVISIDIPPLRDRKGDIPILTDYFVKNISSRLGKSIERVEPKVIDAFFNYDWPGNVRELSNIIERAINLARDKTLGVNLLPPQFQSENKISIWEKTPSKENLEEQMIRTYLNKFQNNKTDVAKAMDISRSSLYRKMEKYGIG